MKKISIAIFASTFCISSLICNSHYAEEKIDFVTFEKLDSSEIVHSALKKIPAHVHPEAEAASDVLAEFDVSAIPGLENRVKWLEIREMPQCHHFALEGAYVDSLGILRKVSVPVRSKDVQNLLGSSLTQDNTSSSSGPKTLGTGFSNEQGPAGGSDPDSHVFEPLIDGLFGTKYYPASKGTMTASLFETLSSTEFENLFSVSTNTYKNEDGKIISHPIINYLPQYYFTTPGEYSGMGTKYGFYVRTEGNETTGYLSDVFVYEINSFVDLTSNSEIEFSVIPRFSYTFKTVVDSSIYGWDNLYASCPATYPYEAKVLYMTNPKATIRINNNYSPERATNDYSFAEDFGEAIIGTKTQYMGATKKRSSQMSETDETLIKYLLSTIPIVSDVVSLGTFVEDLIDTANQWVNGGYKTLALGSDDEELIRNELSFANQLNSGKYIRSCTLGLEDETDTIDIVDTIDKEANPLLFMPGMYSNFSKLTYSVTTSRQDLSEYNKSYQWTNITFGFEYDLVEDYSSSLFNQGGLKLIGKGIQNATTFGQYIFDVEDTIGLGKTNLDIEDETISYLLSLHNPGMYSLSIDSDDVNIMLFNKDGSLIEVNDKDMVFLLANKEYIVTFTPKKWGSGKHNFNFECKNNNSSDQETLIGGDDVYHGGDFPIIVTPGNPKDPDNPGKKY